MNGRKMYWTSSITDDDPPFSRTSPRTIRELIDSLAAPNEDVDFAFYYGKCSQVIKLLVFDSTVVPYLIDYTTTFAIVYNADCTKIYLDMSERFRACLMEILLEPLLFLTSVVFSCFSSVLLELMFRRMPSTVFASTWGSFNWTS